MKWHRLKAVVRKEFIQIWRDPRSLMIALLMPIMQMALLGYGVSLDTKHLPVYAFDREGSQISQSVLKRFQASEYFDVVRTVDNYPELAAALDSDRCKLGIVIPADFSARLNDSSKTAVQALVDGIDNNTANLSIGYAQAVVDGYSRETQLDWLSRQGRAQQAVPPLTVESRTWFNEELESRNFIIPGVVATVMALIGALLSSLTVAREWERGTMERLISTPITPLEIMLGKLLPYFIVGLLDAAFCVAIGVGWFEVPFRGAVTTLLLTTTLFLSVVLGMGFMISAVVKSQIGASQLALVVTLLPTMLLSGFAFPIDQMPAPIRALTYVVYARYYVTILKSLFLKGSGVADLIQPMLALALYAVLVGFFARRALRKTLE
jgi:ABC-2 type transport system permease protein